jgi:hypothetical protein
MPYASKVAAEAAPISGRAEYVDKIAYTYYAHSNTVDKLLPQRQTPHPRDTEAHLRITASRDSSHGVLGTRQ